MTPDDLDRYLEWLAERYARTTTNRRLSVVRSLYADGARDSSCKDILRSLSLARARLLARNDRRSGNKVPPLNPGAFRT